MEGEQVWFFGGVLVCLSPFRKEGYVLQGAGIQPVDRLARRDAGRTAPMFAQES